MSLLGTSYEEDHSPERKDSGSEVDANIADDLYDSSSEEEDNSVHNPNYLRSCKDADVSDLLADLSRKKKTKKIVRLLKEAQGFKMPSSSKPDSKCLTKLYELHTRTELEGFNANAEFLNSAEIYNPAFLKSLTKQFEIKLRDSHMVKMPINDKDDYKSIGREQAQYEKTKALARKRAKAMAARQASKEQVVQGGSMQPPSQVSNPRAEKLRNARKVAIALAAVTNAPTRSGDDANRKRRRIV